MRFVVVVMGMLLAAGCVSSDYLGKTYPRTENVDLYMDEADIKKEYEVMGELTLETAAGMDFMTSSEDMQKEILEKAKEKGADAVVLGSMEKMQKGETSQVSGSTTTTTSTEVKHVRAKLLKYVAEGSKPTPDGQ
jgi:hypothetical protein